MAVSHPPSDGFFGCKKIHGGKIPYSISMKDDSPFAFAGLPPPAKKTPTWKVKLIKEGVRKAIRERAEGPPRTSQRDQFSAKSFQTANR
jgi:putative SOS response-associated peptidase YedK